VKFIDAAAFAMLVQFSARAEGFPHSSLAFAKDRKREK
jgi:hypothetical protein